MYKAYSTTLSISLAIFVLLATAPASVPASTGWAAEPGTTVRNAFGPVGGGGKANQCRGACGAGCPKTCDKTVSYECTDSSRLRRVITYQCGTHQGCRVHDDCLDRCMQSGQGSSCSSQCDADVMQNFGFEKSGSWMIGKGPYDGKINFEYSLDAPGALEPAYSCPDGASRQCSGRAGCTINGAWIEPVFDSYPGAGAGAMRVSAFRSGPACGDRVCEQSHEIRVTGTDSCAGGNCTRFGMEFDYRNADPSAPLECTPSTSGGDSDFIGDLLKQGADAMESRGNAPDPNSKNGMEALMGIFGKVLTSADSPDDVDISMAPLDEQGKPIESQRVGTTPRGGLPPIPRTIALQSTSGHLFVPMYQLASGIKPDQVKERRIRCTHKGNPVLDTTFRLVSDTQQSTPSTTNTRPATSPAVATTGAMAGQVSEVGGNCCSCAITSGKTYSDPRLPCSFEYPASWAAVTSNDSGMISAIASPPPQSCSTICKNGTPVMSVSYGTTFDRNADAMLSIWPMAMRVVGSARCGEGTIKFFSPPGSDPSGTLGGVKFYVGIDGKKYGGAAQFSCGEPGGWVRMRDMFIDSFQDNSASTFPSQ